MFSSPYSTKNKHIAITSLPCAEAGKAPYRPGLWYVDIPAQDLNFQVALMSMQAKLVADQPFQRPSFFLSPGQVTLLCADA